jgi:hypothetical protein
LQNKLNIKVEIDQCINGLEWYNKHFNQISVTFAHALHQEADRIVHRIDDVAKGLKTLPDYSDHVFPKIPSEFYNDNKKQRSKEGTRKGHSKRVGKQLNV